MFRPPARLLYQRPLLTSPFRIPRGSRALSFAPKARRSRSWKNTAVRWALALGAVYVYNTSNVFAEVPAQHVAPRPSNQDDDSPSPTLDEVVAKRRQPSSSQDPPDAVRSVAQGAEVSAMTEGHQGPATPQEYEEEAENEGAFNPETGEINWDCPCLGGMAHGPCGEEFKAAFSCFVYSKEEPKGMDCIDRFKGMQDCFRRYPEVYGAELDDDDEEGYHEHDADGRGNTSSEDSPATPSTPSDSPIPPPGPAQPPSKEESDDQKTDGKDGRIPPKNSTLTPPSTPSHTPILPPTPVQSPTGGESREQKIDGKGGRIPTENSPAIPSTPSDSPTLPPTPVQSQARGAVGQSMNKHADPAAPQANTAAPETERRQKEVPQPTAPHLESGDRGLAPKAWHDEKGDGRTK